MNFTDLTKEEAALVLDGLASLPLAKSYNLFNKLAQQAQQQGQQMPQVAAAPAAGSDVVQ
jgi:hypothetical protein